MSIPYQVCGYQGGILLSMEFNEAVTFKIDPEGRGTGIMELEKMFYESEEDGSGVTSVTRLGL